MSLMDSSAFDAVKKGGSYDPESGAPECECPSDDDSGRVEVGSARTMGILGMTTNMVNAVIGAGVLSLPYSVAQVGAASGLLLLSLGALVSWWGLHLLCKVAVRVGGPEQADNLSFGSVAQSVHRWLPLLASGLAFFNCAVVGIAYLSTFANFMVDVAGAMAPAGVVVGEPSADGVWYLDRRLYVFLTLVATIPLSLPRKVDVLKHTSTVAVGCVLYTAILVVVYAFKPQEELCRNFLERNNASETGCVGELCCVSDAPGAACCMGAITAFSPDGKALIESFPLMINAFCCAAQLFAMYNAFKNPTMRRLDAATASSIATCLSLYVVIAVSGYWTYGSTISDDLLSSYPLTAEVTVARAGIALVVLFSYPLFAHVARDSLVEIVAVAARKPALRDYGTKAGRVFFYSAVALVIVVTTGVSLLNVGLATLLNIVGAVCVSSLNFTLPGLFYLVIFRDEGWTWTRLTAPLLIFLGLLTMLTNFVVWGMK